MARSFNGTSDIIALAIQSSSYYAGGAFGTQLSFAFGCWANLSGGAGSFPIIAGVTGLSGAAQISFGIDVGHFGGLNLYIAGLESKNAASFTTATWHYVIATYVDNGAGTGTITVYDNGSNVTVGQSGTVSVAGYTTNTLHLADGNIAGNSFWKGSIADFAVWTAATGVAPLSAADIAALTNGARPYQIRPSNLVGWWPLDGIQSTEPDFSGKANNGTLTGTSLSAGPPMMMLTPRWPQFLTPPAGGGGSAIKFRKTLSQIGGRVGTRQPIGWGI